MADNITRALVTAPTFINSVLHLPGEFANANLDELGIDEIGQEATVKDDHGNVTKHNLTPGLEKVGAKAEEPIVETPIAAVAPHAPDAPNPQGLPTGTVQSGTGRLVQLETGGLGPMRGASPIVPAKPDNGPVAVQPVGADKPGVAGEQTPQKPEKSSKK